MTNQEDQIKKGWLLTIMKELGLDTSKYQLPLFRAIDPVELLREFEEQQSTEEYYEFILNAVKKQWYIDMLHLQNGRRYINMTDEEYKSESAAVKQLLAERMKS